MVSPDLGIKLWLDYNILRAAPDNSRQRLTNLISPKTDYNIILFLSISLLPEKGLPPEIFIAVNKMREIS
jgi:hypothetical protein